MDKGIYCLLFQNTSCSLFVGRLGLRVFRAGWHIYVGSAQGPGGLIRVIRHIRFARTHPDNPTWHVDHLFLSDCFILRKVICASTTSPLECDLARLLGGTSVPDFGCSDCSCPSHLLFRTDDPSDEIGSAMAILGLFAMSKTII